MRKSELEKAQKAYTGLQKIRSSSESSESSGSFKFPTAYSNRQIQAHVQQDVTPLQGTHDLIQQAKDALKSRFASEELTNRDFVQLVKALRDIAQAEVSVRAEVRDTLGQMSANELLEFVQGLMNEGEGG